MLLRLETLGDVQLNRELLRWEESAADLTPVLAVLVADFREMERRQFSTQGSYSAGGWAPLAPSTLEGKRRHGYPDAILHRTLDLEHSLADEGAPGSVTRIGPDELFAGTSTPYAKYHQTGTRKMPQRKVVAFGEADRIRWVKSVQRYLATGMVATPLLAGPRGL